MIVESPYSCNVEKNLKYARAAITNCIQRGEAPFASHLFYTQVLDNKSPQDRELGIWLGVNWMQVAHAVVIYTDLGISSGMERGIKEAKRIGLSIEYRSLGDNWEKDE